MGQMSRDLAEVYELCRDELNAIELTWACHEAVFRDEDDAAVIERVAPGFARVCAESMRHDAALSLARLADNPNTAQQANLSLKRLAETIDKRQFPQLAQQVAKLVDEFVSAAEDLRQVRHKKLAHNDLERMTRQDIQGRPFWVFAPTRGAIDTAIFKAGEVLRALAGHFGVAYEEAKVGDDSLGRALVRALRERESTAEST